MKVKIVNRRHIPLEIYPTVTQHFFLCFFLECFLKMSGGCTKHTTLKMSEESKVLFLDLLAIFINQVMLP